MPVTMFCWWWLQEVEDLERQLRLMSDNYSALAAANGMGQLTLADRGRSSNKVSAHSIAKKVGLIFRAVPSAGTVFRLFSTVHSTVHDSGALP